MIILRTKDFSKKDYEGLSKRQQKVLKRLRDGKAKELRDNRKAFETFQKMDKGTTGKIGNVEIKINKLKYKSGSKPNGSGMGKAAIENYLKDSAEDAKFYREFVEENVPKDGLIKRGWNKLGKGGKAAVIGVPVAAAAVVTGMAIKNHRDKKKSQN